jgi:phosphoglycolate phosphatase
VPGVILPAQIRGVLFDKDGTLLDYARTWMPANRAAALYAAGGDVQLASTLLRSCGHDPDADTIAPGSVLAAGSVAEIADAFLAILNGPVLPGFHTELAHVFAQTGRRHTTLIAGTHDTVWRLRRAGLALGIATNDTRAGLLASMAPHDLLDAFVFQAAYDDGHAAKPDPAMALAFARHTGLAPAACAIVGDSRHDLDCGRRAGFGLTIAVLSGTSHRDDLASAADVVIETIAQIDAAA